MTMDTLTMQDLACPDSGHCGTCSTCPIAEKCPRGYEPRPADEKWDFDPTILEDEPIHLDEVEYDAELDIWGGGDANAEK